MYLFLPEGGHRDQGGQGQPGQPIYRGKNWLRQNCDEFVIRQVGKISNENILSLDCLLQLLHRMPQGSAGAPSLQA